jgi:hypothetical protein
MWQQYVAWFSIFYHKNFWYNLILDNYLLKEWFIIRRPIIS